MSRRKIDRKRLPAGLASQSPAAPSHARLLTLQPAVGQVASTEDVPLVKGSISGVAMTFLVDTGANVTIVKSSVFNKITASERPPLDQVETSMLLADGSSLPFLGRGRLRISLGKE